MKKNIVAVLTLISCVACDGASDMAISGAELSATEMLKELDDETFLMACESEQFLSEKNVTGEECANEIMSQKEICLEKYSSDEQVVSAEQMESLTNNYVDCVISIGSKI